MSVIKRINLTPVARWWIEIRPSVNLFSDVIQESPMLKFEDADAIAKQLKKLYEHIQQTPCPDAADEIYTYLTRAVLNLFMCYEALANFQWDKGDVFYGRATSDWIYARGTLHQEGIVQIAV